MSSSSKPYLLLLLLLLSLKIFIVHSFVLPFTEAAKHGFTVELIHRDSPKSPFYNHSQPLSSYQKVKNSVRRSFQRVNSFFPNSELARSDDIVTDVIFSRGEYLVEYSVGTPDRQNYGMIDTASSLVWLQCLPCEKCFETQVPVFNPSSSTTFTRPSCNSTECDSARGGYDVSCDRSNNECSYEIKYDDGARSKGKIVKDTLSLRRSNGGRKVAFPHTVFGCAHYVDGRYSTQSSGMVGLGRGPFSLISQMGYEYRSKFSYCLVPFPTSGEISQLSFGQNAFAYDSETVSTPIASQYPDHYHLTLEGISVGNTRLEYKAEEGNIAIDNGSTMTYLPQDVMYKLEAGLAGVIPWKFRRVHEESFDLCFSSQEGFEDFEPPTITFHFKGKADVELYPSHTFIATSPETMCLTIVSSPEKYSLLGVWAQTNYLIGFDLLSNLVSFKFTDCTL